MPNSRLWSRILVKYDPFCWPLIWTIIPCALVGAIGGFVLNHTISDGLIGAGVGAGLWLVGIGLIALNMRNF